MEKKQLQIPRQTLEYHASQLSKAEGRTVTPEELMERFVQGDSSRNTEGSGLGLNIAATLMEVQKGRMHLTVDGDLFKVTLVFPGC